MQNTHRKPYIVDLHSHILPGMDDGSPDLETTRALLQRLAEQGVSAVCATPHYYAEREPIAAFAERREAAYQRTAVCLTPELHTILPGAEVALFRRISESRELDTLCLRGTRTLLLEMPFSEWTQSQVEEVISLVLDREYQVVLVHPERFTFSKTNKEALEKLSELPIAFQVNADTLCRWNGRKNALALLQMTETPLLGTDCHNLGSRAPHLDKAREVVARKLGGDFLHRMDQNAVALALVPSGKEAAAL